MRTILKFMMAASVVAFISCTKESADNQIDNGATFPQVLVSFDVDEPVAEPDTRIVHSESGGVHTIKWKAGDQFSLFGYVNSATLIDGVSRQYEVVNYSANRYSLVNGDGTKTFNGYFPNLKEIYGEGSKVLLNQYGIYPAATVEVTRSNPASTGFSNYYAVPVTPLAIPADQDGSGWPYALFFSRTAQFSEQYLNPSPPLAPIIFSLGCVMLRLKVDSEKPVVSVTLSTTDAPVLVGNVTKIECSATGMWIAAGCATKTLTVSNGGVLPNDLYFAVRDLRVDKTYTFKFTAQDGSTYEKAFKVKGILGSDGKRKNYDKNLYSLGTVTPVWTPAQ